MSEMLRGFVWEKVAGEQALPDFSLIFRYFSFAFSGRVRKVPYKSQAVHSLQVISIKNYSLGLYVGCLHLLNRGVRLIEVEFTVFY